MAYIFVAICAILVLGAAPSQSQIGFNRACTSDLDCTYNNRAARDNVFLACVKGKCACQIPRHKVQDVAHYDVEIKNGKCEVHGKPPCGT